MRDASVTGMAVSLFNNNKPVYHKVFGYKNSDTKAPLQTNTNFYGASLSKAVFAVLVMKLVEEKIKRQQEVAKAVIDAQENERETLASSGPNANFANEEK